MFDSVAERAGDVIFDRTQSRLSRWCQVGTLCTKCVANLVNSQRKSLQVSYMYRRPTVQIQASRYCNFIFQSPKDTETDTFMGLVEICSYRKGSFHNRIDQETHFDLAENVKNLHRRQK